MPWSTWEHLADAEHLCAGFFFPRPWSEESCVGYTLVGYPLMLLRKGGSIPGQFLLSVISK